MAEIDFLSIKTGNVINLPNLADGELGFSEDTKKLFIGSVSGNVGFPNSDDIAVIQSSVDGAISTSNNAQTLIANALEIANLSKATATSALQESIDTQAQVANIIASNSSGQNTEIVDLRTSADSTVWDTAGDHVRNIDKINEVLKNIQTFTATVVTSSIPIDPSITAIVDVSTINIDVFYKSTILTADNYSIDIVNKAILLNGWTLIIGGIISYRVYK